MYYFSVTVFEGIMIKANELRIGNLVGKNNYGISDNPVSVSHIEVENIGIGGVNSEYSYGHFSPKYVLEELSPIPLAEEWLLKFGFAKGYKYTSLETAEFDLDYDCLKNELYISFGDSPFHTELPHIKHVHQLQNLYFALTGEELTIK